MNTVTIAWRSDAGGLRVYRHEQKTYDSAVWNIPLLGQHVYGIQDCAFHDSAGDAAGASVYGGGSGAVSSIILNFPKLVSEYTI